MKNPGLRYGVFGGLSVVLYFLSFYYSQKNLFINPVVQWTSMIIYVLCMYRAAREDFALHGVERDFRLLTRTPFLVFILINLAYWLFYYSIHLADPELLAMETQAQLSALQQQIAAGVGDPEQANLIREQIQFLQKEGMSMTLGPVLMQMARGAIGGFGLASVLVILLKNSYKN
jgi:hypothetical protein